MYDSAYYYYQRSMESNIAADSRLGIGCAIFILDSFTELQEEHDKAESHTVWHKR